VPRKPNGNGSRSGDGGNLDDIREILRDTVAIQRQQAKVLRQHGELLIEHEKRMAEHDVRMAAHDVRMAEHDERMDRVGRHLEVLSTITDELIRGKADRKRR